MLRKAFAVCLMALAGQTHAGLINFSGTFSATDASFPIPTISGSFGFIFDDSVVTTGLQRFQPLALSSLTFSPDPYAGTFSFDTLNTAAYLEYLDGALFRLDIGGLLIGVTVVGSGTNDFSVAYILQPPFTAFLAAWTATVSRDDIANANISGSLTSTPVSVPEPGTLSLLAAGLIALGFIRRRSQSQIR